jgi:exosortase
VHKSSLDGGFSPTYLPRHRGCKLYGTLLAYVRQLHERTAQTMRDSDSKIIKKHAAFTAFVAISILVFWKTLSSLLAYSLTRESSSHIILIPFVSIYLLYTDRTRIFPSMRTSIGLAIGLICAGVAVYSFATWRVSPQDGNGLLPAATFSLVLIWLGGFFLFYGTQAAWTAAFPLLFLLLMVPLPDGILNRVVYLLQKGSTEITYLLFRMTGVPVLKQGFLLSVPGVTIEVAQECSGIRSSVALFITCLLAAHLFLRTTWRQAVFALLAFPLAIIKNAIRIATLTLLSIYVNPNFLTGRLHHEGGFVFFLLILAVLAPVLRLLQKSEPDRKSFLLAL